MKPRILISGPLDALEEYAAAAETAGWQAIAQPLLRIETRTIVVPEPLACDLVCITSANAIVSLVDLARRYPQVRNLPVACVGARTAARLESAGFAVSGPPREDAAGLVAAVVARQPRPERILWPRGSRATEFAAALRAQGLDVLAPLAYETFDAPPAGTLPDAAAVFLASPSALRVYLRCARARPLEDTVAVAIGSTTAAAIDRSAAPFHALAVLPHPAPDALAWRLQHLGFDAPRP